MSKSWQRMPVNTMPTSPMTITSPMLNLRMEIRSRFIGHSMSRTMQALSTVDSVTDSGITKILYDNNDKKCFNTKNETWRFIAASFAKMQNFQLNSSSVAQ